MSISISERQLRTSRLPSVFALAGLGRLRLVRPPEAPGLLLGLTVMVFTFLVGCGLILAGLTFIRGWREADASERLEDADWLPSAQEVGEPVGHPHLLSPAGRAEREAG